MLNLFNSATKQNFGIKITKKGTSQWIYNGFNNMRRLYVALLAEQDLIKVVKDDKNIGACKTQAEQKSPKAEDILVK